MAKHLKVPMNTCEACFDAGDTGSFRSVAHLAQSGSCGRCAAIGPVVDLDLLAFYKVAGIPEALIGTHFPRLRQQYPFDVALPQSGILMLIDRYYAQKAQQEHRRRKGA
ncbi:hypothetical protein [Paenirhodobacter populi]|uniref:hypothetical protein n=1 Tax=Paenirhodobacter populi TaxID=2306993 RepID=UPI0013E3B075|nr:hypothetical protein [Sinirhodobacter populi]